MKLTDSEFKRFKELEKLIKAKKASGADKEEYDALKAKKNDRGSNDPKWWMNYPRLVEDVSNLPFNYIPGTQQLLESPAGGTFLDVVFGNVYKVVFMEGIGRSVSNTDAFNTQIRQLWLDLHRKYRGIGTYEQADLGIAILAIRSAFNMLAKFERIYGIINTYHVGNRVVPVGLKDALHISADLERNLADFRYFLNFNIERMKQLCLPKGLSALDADIAVLSNVFKDSEDRRASLFLFDTNQYGRYNPTALNTGGCVEYKVFTYSTTTPSGFAGFTLNDIIVALNDAIDALLSDDDIARICSDLLAAYGPENVETLVNVPEQYYVEPVHDYERQLQFHNTTLVGIHVGGVYDNALISAAQADALEAAGIRNVIYQNNNVVISELAAVPGIYANHIQATIGGATKTIPVTTSNVSTHIARAHSVLLDTWVDKPSAAEVMVGTRFSAITEAVSYDGSNKYQMLSCWGTQVPTYLAIYGFVGATGVYTNVNVEASDTTTIGTGEVMLLTCDWHPMVYYVNAGQYKIIGDVDNFCVINRNNMSRIHDVAILSGFKFSQVATVGK